MAAIFEKHTYRVLITIFMVSVVSHVGVLGNPGYFSHDEWDRVHSLNVLGFWGYMASAAQIQAGPEFGYPVRPIGFVQQGLSALWMNSAPLVVHSVDVALHAVIAMIMSLALMSLRAQRPLPELAGVAFALSPLTTGAVAWMGASFDQWYTLFMVLACWTAVLIYRGESKPAKFVVLFLCSAGAMLSKEAAVVLPAMISLCLLVFYSITQADRFLYRRALAILSMSAIPIALYMAIRLPALMVSFGGGGHGAYSPSLSFLIPNAIAYFTFPFLPSPQEMRAPIPLGTSAVLAVLLHGALIILLARNVSWTVAGAYLIAYFLPLGPVLPLVQPAAHYIHASAVPLALVFAVVAAGAWRQGAIVPIGLIVVGGILMTVHLSLLQYRFYQDGLCQSRFLISLPARLAAYDPVPGPVALEAEGSVRSWAMRRVLHDRQAYDGLADRPLVRFVEDLPRGAEPSLRLRVTATCEVR